MSDKQSTEKALEKYKEQNANILGPAISLAELSEFHKIVLDPENLSIKPADGDIYKYKDKYKDRPAQYIITGQGLKKLALCAGVQWHPTQTRATVISQKYVAYNAVGFIRKPDGTPDGYQGEADIDIDVEEDILRENFKKKRKEWLDGPKSWFRDMDKESQDDYIDNAFRKELNYKKKHKMKIAATNARSRVIRPLLRIKPTYTLAELSRPFVMPRVVLVPNYRDPEVRKIMLTAAIQSQTSVFGPAPSQTIEDVPIDIPAEDFHDVLPDDEDPPLPDDDQTSEEGDDPMPPTDKEVFQDMSAKEQIEALIQMAEAKDYVPKQPTRNLAPKERLSFFIALAQMPDKE